MNGRISFVTVSILSLLLGWMTFTRPVNGVMNWDVTGYYFYLPAAFIYEDLPLRDISWIENLRAKYDLSGTLYQFHPVENQTNFVDQYSAGMAVMYSPAFFVGHLIAASCGYEQDGFSLPYQWSMAIWSFLVALLGILSLRKLLLLFFDDRKTALILVLILAGSNYFIQISRGLCTPHNYLFTLYAVFLLSVVRWHQTKSIFTSIVMSISLGLACLARPTEFIAVVIPLFWGCRNGREIGQKMKWLWKEKRRTIFLIAGIMLLVALPQLIYWKTTTGNWFYMSYTNPAEGFDFLYPHTIDFLFSYRKGWFIYTPLMLFALSGFIWLYTKRRDLLWPLGIFFLLNLYVISSWSCWWYAQCFSQRAMVQTLPVMALLLGFSLVWLQQKKGRKIVGGIIISVFFLQTAFFQWQYENYVLDQWRMTKDYFWSVYGKTSAGEDNKKLLLIDRPFDGKMIFKNKNNYEETNFFSYAHLSPQELDQKVVLDSVEENVEIISGKAAFTGTIKKRFSELTKKDHVWIEASAKVWLTDSSSVADVLLVCTADHSGGLYGYRTAGVLPDSLIGNGWNTIRFDYLTPEVRTRRDYISFYVWYRGQDSAYVKDFSIRVFEKK